MKLNMTEIYVPQYYKLNICTSFCMVLRAILKIFYEFLIFCDLFHE